MKEGNSPGGRYGEELSIMFGLESKKEGKKERQNHVKGARW